MENKKYSLLIGLICLLGAASYAQDGSAKVGTNYNVLDSSFYSTKNLPQFNEFRNNAYPFPPKPRNQWEIGIKGGAFTVIGDVPAVIPTGGFGLHIRKALGYVFSLRLEYMYGIAKGLNWQPRGGGYSAPFLNAGYTGLIYDNYKTKYQDLSLETLISLTNIMFHKAKSNVDVYAILGIGAGNYNTKVNALNGTSLYNFASISGGNYSGKKDTRKALKSLMDDSYETAAETDGKGKIFGNPAAFTASFGAGIAFKLSKKVNLAVEDKVGLPFTDLLDGQRWQASGVRGTARVLTGRADIFNYLTVGLNLNLGKSTKRIEPLYWINPLDYAYSELNTPKHMKFPKPILDDADGDGITDQFDLEPNTPKGAAVDSHGVSRDTDGDGVPDYKDKELITPTQCQPVDADGVGKCPEPACCQTLDSLIKAGGIKNCNLGSLPSISFAAKSSALSNDAKAVLASVAETVRNNPNCKVAVVGYGESNKTVQQLSWDRVNTVINYLVEKEGISQDRFIFKYGEPNGDANTIDLREAGTDETPNSVPAPHPSLMKKKK